MSLAVSISCIKAAHLSSFYIHLFTFHEFLLDHVSLFQQTHLPTRWLKKQVFILVYFTHQRNIFAEPKSMDVR
jgi:hypothetical protein